MSTLRLRCSTCHDENSFVHCAPFPVGQETTYGVVWRCPAGHGEVLDICPLGPLVPNDQMCMNCGSTYSSGEAVCTDCGLSREACPDALGLDDPNNESPLVRAGFAFQEGLFRRGLAILNYSLRENQVQPEVWLIKTRFMHSLGYYRSAAQMLETVLSIVTAVEHKVVLLEEQSFLLAECQLGEAAFNSANKAMSLGSKSIRTHYLRGRGLAMIGQLEEARREMLEVLTLDPANSDALRGFAMIEAALPTESRKHWWQFWKL